MRSHSMHSLPAQQQHSQFTATQCTTTVFAIHNLQPTSNLDFQPALLWLPTPRRLYRNAFSTIWHVLTTQKFPKPVKSWFNCVVSENGSGLSNGCEKQRRNKARRLVVSRPGLPSNCFHWLIPTERSIISGLHMPMPKAVSAASLFRFLIQFLNT